TPAPPPATTTSPSTTTRRSTTSGRSPLSPGRRRPTSRWLTPRADAPRPARSAGTRRRPPTRSTTASPQAPPRRSSDRERQLEGTDGPGEQVRLHVRLGDDLQPREPLRHRAEQQLQELPRQRGAEAEVRPVPEGQVRV